MKTRQFWYPLPTRLIAQRPVETRGTDRMMVLHRETGVIEHRHIANIVEYLDEKDPANKQRLRRGNGLRERGECDMLVAVENQEGNFCER